MIKRHQILLALIGESPAPLTIEYFNSVVAYLSCYGTDLTNGMYDYVKCADSFRSIQFMHDFELLNNSGMLNVIDGCVINNMICKDAAREAFNIIFHHKSEISASHAMVNAKPECDLIKLVEAKIGSTATNLLHDVNAIYTIGYECDSIDAFISRVLNARVSTIIDVRKNPVSRKFGFSKKKLSECLKLYGVEYCHFPDLGIPSESRQHLKTPDDYVLLFDEYEKTILSSTEDTQDEVLRIAKRSSAALLCFEKDPMLCHRGRLAKSLAKKSGRKIIHL